MKKCESCGGNMTFSYNYPRGRHYKDVYLCDDCKAIKTINVGLIPNLQRRNFR